MYSFSESRFRQDLLVISSVRPGVRLAPIFQVKDLQSGKAFELSEEEYFICQHWDGHNTPEGICDTFRRNFQQELSKEDLFEFLQALDESDFLEPININLISSNAKSSPPFAPYWFLVPIPHRFIKWSADISQQFRLIWWIFIFISIPLIPIGLITLWKHWLFFFISLSNITRSSLVPLLIPIHLMFVLVSIFNRYVQSVILEQNGRTVSQWGFALGGGFLPFFRMEFENLETLQRSEKLWFFGTPVLLRLIFLATSVLIWFTNYQTNTTLANCSVILVVIFSLSVLVDSIPFWQSDGYAWMILYFKLPPLIQRSQLFLSMIWYRKPLPRHLTIQERIALTAFGCIGIFISVLIFGLLSLSLGFNMAHFLSIILGKSAYFLSFILLIILLLRYLLRYWWNVGR